MTDLVILFFGLMSHVAGDGDRAAVLINAPAHTAEMRVLKTDLSGQVPAALNARKVGDYYHIPLTRFRVSTNVGFGTPVFDPSVATSVPSLATVSGCTDLKKQVQKRTDDPDIAAYFIYRGGTVTVASYETFTGKFDVWPEERCMPRALEWRISDARNVEFIFTHLDDNATWSFGVRDGAQITISNHSMEAGHFHHQYKIFQNCTGPSPAAGQACPRANGTAAAMAKIGVQGLDIECTPTQVP